MKIVEVERSGLPRGYYAEHVAEYGHEPGVLSGAELAGGARKWGWYSKMRTRVEAALRGFGVHRGYALIETRPGYPRWCVVWLDAETGERVGVSVV